MHSALVYCLSCGHDRLAGYLLKHVGHDEEGGTITLTGLKLGSLQAHWLAPALNGNATCASAWPASNEWLELVEKAAGFRSVRHRLSASVTALDDDADGSAADTSSQRFLENESLASAGESPVSPKSSSDEASPVAVPRSESRQRAESRSSVDSNDRYQLTSLVPNRLRTVSGASIPYSSSDPRLVTVLESKQVILPETPFNEAFCVDEADVFAQPRMRGYSDCALLTSDPPTPMLLRRMSKSGSHLPPGNSPPVSKRRNLPRSRSGGCIEGRAAAPRECLPKNPIHRLDLSRNEIHNVDILAKGFGSWHKHLRFVEKLDLSYNKLEAIPHDLRTAMPQLRELVLKHNHLTAIPSCIFAWTSLEKLNLSHNAISHVVKPPGLLNTSLLSHLDLSNNAIEEFPTWFGDNVRLLTTLDLSANRLGPIPDKPVNLHKLESLNLSGNQIRVIPPKFLANMKELESFQASHNGLKSLPDTVAPFLSKLGIVRLSHNQLSEKAPFYLTRYFDYFKLKPFKHNGVLR